MHTCVYIYIYICVYIYIYIHTHIFVVAAAPPSHDNNNNNDNNNHTMNRTINLTANNNNTYIRNSIVRRYIRAASGHLDCLQHVLLRFAQASTHVCLCARQHICASSITFYFACAPSYSHKQAC